MSLRKRVLASTAGLLLLLAGGTTLSAQDLKTGLTGGLGTEVIGGQTFQTLNLLPDLDLGPFGVGIDLSFHFLLNDPETQEFGFYPRGEDWWDTSADFSENLDKWTSRLAYFRYGKAGEPLYVQLGVLPSVSLGNGFIVGGYSNNMLAPARKFSGLVVGVDGSLFQFPYAGAQTFVNNISGFNLIGLRAYAKPFALLTPDVAFLSPFQIGLTGAWDTNPYVYEATVPAGGDSASVGVIGLDASLPLVNLPVFTARAALDYALQGGHSGGSAGVNGSALAFLTWGVNLRFAGDNFLPTYFGKAYDLYRAGQYALYSDTGVGEDALKPGSLGWQASLGGDILGKLTLGASLGGPLSGGGVGKYSMPNLESYVTIKDIPLIPLSVDAYYNKEGISDFADLLDPADAVIGARVGYEIGNTTITMVYSLSFVEGSTEPVTTSRLETAIKLF